MDVRKKLIGLIAKAKYICANDYSDHTEDEYIADTLLDNGVTVQEWIPVKERKPDKEFWEHRNMYKDEDLEVLVIIKGAKMATTLLYNAEGKFYSPDDMGRYNLVHGATYYAVTHWMPLPTAPKETRK